MGLDIRLPIGMLFTALGVILVLFGAFSNRALYDRSLGINVNLAWGAVLLAFGIVMLALGKRGASRQARSAERTSVAGSR
jgi:dipeptide/tripeptide permease